jgi:hypothetical protein
MIRITFFAVLFLTLFALIAGMFLFLKGGPLYKKYGNALMRWRIILQGATLILFFLMFWWG